MIVIVEVMPKPGILDPQGKAVCHALHQMQFPEVEAVKVGKIIRLELEENDKDKAFKRADEMAQKLLYNHNVESYKIVMPEGENK